MLLKVNSVCSLMLRFPFFSPARISNDALLTVDAARATAQRWPVISITCYIFQLDVSPGSVF